MPQNQIMPTTTSTLSPTDALVLLPDITSFPPDSNSAAAFPTSNLVTLPPSAAEALSPSTTTLVSESKNQTGPSVPINSPAGGISMTKPPQTAISFYKIAPNEIVTFGWNFTSI